MLADARHEGGIAPFVNEYELGALQRFVEIELREIVRPWSRAISDSGVFSRLPG